MPVLHEIPFSDFVASRSARLLHLAYLLTRDRGQAEDLLQTALARAWPAWRRIKDPEAYVRRIMVTTYSAWWRRKWNGEVPTGELPERVTLDPHSGVDVHGVRPVRGVPERNPDARCPRAGSQPDDHVQLDA